MKQHERLRKLAAEQHGCVARRQCRAVGLDGDALRAALRRGDWEVLTPRVLRLVGVPPSDGQRVMAAVLDAGRDAVASHRTAAALWRLPGFDLARVEVSRPHAGRREPTRLARVHHPRPLPAHHTTVVDGIPITTPARTLFDLAAVLPPGRLERTVDSALASSPALLRALHRMLAELAARGRTGIRAMRAILDERPLGFVAPASGLEARVMTMLEEAGLRVRRQVDLGGDDWIGRVDILVEGTDLVVEVDGARFHTSLSDRRRDAARDAALAAAGRRVLRVTEEEVWTAPGRVVHRVRRALRRAA